MDWLGPFRFKAEQIEAGFNARKRFIAAGRLAFCLLLILILWPVAFRTTRAAELILILFLWCDGLFIWWSRRIVRSAFLSSGILAVVMFSLPGRESSSVELRAQFIRELRGLEGTRYVWGGENRLGIDCSGLARRAFINSLWKEGFRSFNCRLCRSALSVWWQDASAQALAVESHGQTVRIQNVDSLRSETPAWLKAGDLAITDDGIHVLVYLGDGKWIEADPDVGRVISLPTSNQADESNIWLSVPMTIVRWRLLQDADSSESFASDSGFTPGSSLSLPLPVGDAIRHVVQP